MNQMMAAARTLVVPVLLALLAAAPAAHAATSARPSVVGGTVLADGAEPWAAALVQAGAGARESQFCGGALIAPAWVITAAHCVAGLSPGEIDVVVNRARLTGSGGERIGVGTIRVHPSYSQATGTHDLTLLQLVHSASSAPVPLADASAAAVGSTLTVSGWGLLSTFASEASDDLHAASVLALSDRVCRGAYGPSFEAATMICAVGPGGTDSCRGDSGGPLTATSGLVGVVSFGGRECGNTASPGVYTRLSAMSDFISSTVGTATVAPVSTQPQVVNPDYRTRIGRITCGARRCRVDVSVAGGTPPAVLLRVQRSRGRGHRAVDRIVRAKRLSGTRWRASLTLPYGALRITARPYDLTGRPLGRTAVVSLRVTG